MDKAIIKELRDQGHYLTGGLERSLHHTAVEVNGASRVIGGAAFYSKILHWGVLPARIPFRQGSGAKSSKYIDALYNYWKHRGLSDKEAKRAAFATARKHKTEGMPTKNSYTFSKTGSRKNFVEIVREKAGKKVQQKIDTGLRGMVSKEFHKTKSGII